MRGRAWGKSSPSSGDGPLRLDWHPLVDHCADVAATLEALLRETLLSDRLFRPCALPLRDERLIQRLSAIAFLHDLGKANRGFQNKIRRHSGEAGAARMETAGHVRELWPLLEGDAALQRRLCEILPAKHLCTWVDGEAFLPLVIAAVSHHGTPWNSREPCRCAHLWQPAGGYDPFEALVEMGDRLGAWFPMAFASGAPRLPDNAQFQHAFAGLVMLADWLGSHRVFFPFSNSQDPDRMTFARRAAGEAVAAVGLAVEGKRETVRAARPRFAGTFPFAPNPMQNTVGDFTGSRLAILEAETGSGKTEAALWRFKRLFEDGEVDGLYFALPTRIAATQIHRRVCEAAARLWPEEKSRPGVLLAVPGYVKVDEAEARGILPGFEVLWANDPNEAEAHRRWAGENPKRFLAAQIAVGTIDQALLSNLQVRHAHLRSAALLRHLLVVDEVHASDAYMTALLRSVLDVHLAAGGHALLMSATLGSVARASYLLGRRPPPSLNAALAVPYPALSLPANGEERQVAFAAGGGKRVRWQARPILTSQAAIAVEALAAARAGAAVLVVRNTVGGAIAAQKALEAQIAADGDRPEDGALLFRCRGIATLHHCRFAREDRRLLDDAVEAWLGRKRRPGGAIVIGTQTLEQSLDIDADLLITDLCPMDVLLQRIGRLHRHVRSERPAGYQAPLCLVAVPGERDLTPLLRRPMQGLGIVYPAVRIIEATWRLIEALPEIAIPAMNRELVERSTHPFVLAQIDVELGEAWKAAAARLDGQTAAQRGVAHLHGIDRRKPFGEIAFADLDEIVRTRLGADDRLVDWRAVQLDPPMGPFGRPVQALTLPDHLCKGLPADAEPGTPEARPDGFVFAFGEKRFLYGRYGLLPLKEAH